MKVTNGAKEREGVVRDAFEDALMKRLVAIRITEGGTKIARSHVHVFVPGEIYGGKLGSLLCKKGYKEWQTFNTNTLRFDVCPKCAKKLAQVIAYLASRHHTDKLLAIAAGSFKIPSFSDQEIDAALRATAIVEYEKQAAKKAPKPQLSVFDMEEIKKSVQRTELCPTP